MDNLEKELNKLPKARLSKRSDWRIRFNIYKKIINKELKQFRLGFFPARFNYLPAVALILLLAIIITVPGYAYASSKVTLGHPLYPIKQVIENAELSLAKTGEQKAETYAKLAERRVAEAEVLSKENKEEAIVKTLSEAVRLANNASGQAALINKEPERRTVQAGIEKSAEEQALALESVAKEVGIRGEERTIDSIALSLDAFRKDARANVKQTEEEEPSKHKDTFSQTSSTPRQIRESARKDYENIEIATPTLPRAVDMGKATSGPETKKEVKKEGQGQENINLPEINKNKQTASLGLGEVKNQVENLRAELENDGFDPEDVKILFERLDEKIKNAEKSIKEEKNDNLEKVLESTEALTNNAKHFIKQKKAVNSAVEDSGELEANKENSSGSNKDKEEQELKNNKAKSNNGLEPGKR